MAVRLLLICSAATAATRRGAFSTDEPLEAAAAEAAKALRRSLPRTTAALCGPSLRARQTAAALGLQAEVDPRLDDFDAGRWSGRLLHEISRAEPAAVDEWLTDPDAAPHGGESLDALLRRVTGWLSDCQGGTGTTIAVTHAATIRALLVVALAAASASFWRFDVAPLSCTTLSGRDGRWNLQAIERHGSSWR